MKSLFVYLKNYIKECVMGPLFKLLEASFELLVPLVVADIIDKGIVGADKSYIISRVFILILLAVVGFVTVYALSIMEDKKTNISGDEK